MFRRGEPRDIARILSRLIDRVERLENIASRRSLPAGFTWIAEDDGSLIVRRDSDGVTAVVISA